MHFRDGRYIADAVEAARRSDVAIVFATEWRTEGLDQPDLSLPDGQDALIAAVAAANPRTIVVLETGGPVAMPWLDKTAAVLEAWYPGARGGEAIARCCLARPTPAAACRSRSRPASRNCPGPSWMAATRSIPISWATRRRRKPRSGRLQHRGLRRGLSLVRATGAKPLFPFGYGLSYTTLPRRAERGWQDRALYPAQHRQGGGR
jgi:beta-glucosidase